MLLKILNHKFPADSGTANSEKPSTADAVSKEDENQMLQSKPVLTHFKPLMSEEEQNAAAEKEPSTTYEEKNINEIQDMQKELEAMMSKVERLDPMQMLKEVTVKQTDKMNADLAML